MWNSSAALFVVLVLAGLMCYIKTESGHLQLRALRALSLELGKEVQSLNKEVEVMESRVGRVSGRVSQLKEDLEKAKRDLEQERERDYNRAAFLQEAQASLEKAKLEAYLISKQEIVQVNTTVAAKLAALEEAPHKVQARIDLLESKKNNLSRSIAEAEGKLAVGHALINGDPLVVELFIKRMLGRGEPYSGSYVYNQQIAAPMNERILLPKWNGLVVPIGVATRELRTLLPKKDPFTYPKRVFYRTCAVVGNSGLLLSYRLGSEIDAHDAVIRINAGVTSGFEESVGNSTDIRFVNRLHFGFREKEGEVVLQHVTNEETLRKFVAQKRDFPASRLFMVSTDFHAHVQRELRKPATNGLYAILFALQRCEQVTAYGFFRGEDDRIPYHYFDSETPEKSQRSRDLQEAPLIMELARKSGNTKYQFLRRKMS